MPYITKQERQKLQEHSCYDACDIIVKEVTRNQVTVNRGNLNNILTTIIWRIFDVHPSYAIANDLIGVLECVKQEFYRRRVAVYEEDKRKLNGDVI